ncbi:FAD-binding oxidoreductase [Sulfitobacter sp. LCG007]
MNGRSAIVIGAGITGVSAAEWLRRDGWAVTLLDPLAPGDPGQTSFGNAGLIARTSVLPVATPSLVRKAPAMILDPSSPLFLRWSYLPRLLPWLVPFLRNATPGRIREIAEALSAITFDSNDQHLALARRTGAERFIASGDFITLYRQRSDYEGDRLTLETRARFGLEAVPLSRAELVERDPHLGADYRFGAIFGDFRWITSPGKYVAALADHFRSGGGIFRQARAVRVDAGDCPGVTIEGGETLQASKVVLTAGAWSGRLTRSLGTGMRLETERGYQLAMLAPSFTAPGPYMVSDAKLVVTPMEGFLRAAGVVELAGLDAPAIRQPLKVIETAMKRLYPALEFERTEHWMGRRPTTPDSLPALGEDVRAPNVLHAYGGQHIGLTIGPKLGRLVADLASGRAPNIDLGPYRPGRFRRSGGG